MTSPSACAVSERETSAIRVIRRIGRPPLRFRGRCLARHAAETASHRMEIALWSCESGGFVVGMAIRGAGQSARDADRVPDAAAAFALVESFDLAGHMARAGTPGGSRDVIRAAGTLAGRARTAVLTAGWRDLIGEALADWDTLAG